MEPKNQAQHRPAIRFRTSNPTASRFEVIRSDSGFHPASSSGWDGTTEVGIQIPMLSAMANWRVTLIIPKILGIQGPKSKPWHLDQAMAPTSVFFSHHRVVFDTPRETPPSMHVSHGIGLTRRNEALDATERPDTNHRRQRAPLDPNRRQDQDV